MKKILTTLFAICLILLFTACWSGSQTHGIENQTPIPNTGGGTNISAPMISGDFPTYDSIAHLTSVATYVIRGEVLDERVENLNVSIPPENEEQDTGMYLESHYRIFTVYRIKVLEVFQGDTSTGDIIEVRLLGSQLDDDHLPSADHTYFTIGDNLVLFLQASALEHLPPFLVNPTQSTYRIVVPTEGLTALGVNEELESISPKNDLTLTIGDLQQIADGTLGNNSR